MAVLRENFQEQAPPPSRKDDPDYFGLNRIASAGDDMTVTTPVVEIEQPLLEAPEVSELARKTQFDFVIDGMVLTMLGDEDEESLAVSILCWTLPRHSKSPTSLWWLQRCWCQIGTSPAATCCESAQFSRLIKIPRNFTQCLKLEVSEIPKSLWIRMYVHWFKFC